MGGFRNQGAARITETHWPGDALQAKGLANVWLRSGKLFLAIVLVLALAACNLPKQGGADLVLPTGDNLPQVKIDSPREGTVLPPGPYEVVFHGSGPAGIEKGELSVNSMVVATLPNPDSGAPQVVFRTSWSPSTGPGRYLLQARVKDKTGRWSEYADVTVMIGATATPSPTITATPTRTATPAITFTPIPSPSPSATPTITPSATPMGALGYRPQAWPDVFYTSGCIPDHVDFSVQVEPARDVANLYLFVQLEDQAFGGLTGWGVPLSMAKTGLGQYAYTLVPGRIPGGAGLYNSAILLLQFVAQDGGGSIISRSDVFAASSLVRCGEHPVSTVTTGTGASGRLFVTLAPFTRPSSTPVKK